MAKIPAVMGVHLLDAARGPMRVGTLTRDAEGGVSFVVAETYLQDEKRPILSLGWFDPASSEGTRDRLAARSQKVAINGFLPPWFSGLLPEGALHEMVLSEMGPGDHDQFDVLTRLGADLPGAVLVTPETAIPASAGPAEMVNTRGFQAPLPSGLVKFSLAGVQLKFTADLHDGRLTVPGRGESGRCIIKVASERYAGLPEAEHAGMLLARSLGVNTADCRLISRDVVSGIPDEMMAHGEHVLVVDRFDRSSNGNRIHIEDTAQILGAAGERKYTMGTAETVINTVRRFSTDNRSDILEAVRRIVADVLIGNGDNHLKNWSFRFPMPGQIRLSPAYDIVPTVLFMPGDTMALQFIGTRSFETVNLRRFERVAKFLDLDPRWMTREVRDIIVKALDTWPSLLNELLPREHTNTVLSRLDGLRLVQEVRG